MRERWSEKVDGKRRRGKRAPLPVALQMNSTAAIAAFVGAVLEVDETDDVAVFALLDRHCAMHDRERVTDDDREVLRGMRRMIERVYLCMSWESDEQERADLRTGIRAWCKADAVKHREPNIMGKRKALVALMTRARNGAFSKLERTIANATGSEMDRIMWEMGQIDRRLEGHRSFVRELVEAMRADMTVNLACSKLTMAARVFGDHDRMPRAVRRLFDCASPVHNSGSPLK